MFEPVKVGFSEYMIRFFNQLVPTTKPLHEYVAREVGKSIVWAPSQMFDTATEMLEAWQRNDTDNLPTMPHKLPVMIVAFGRDFMPTGRDFTRQIGESQRVMLPNDPLERVFGLRSIAGDISAQVAIFAADSPTALSIASQFVLWLDTIGNHGFTANFTFAGQNLAFPVQIESPETLAQAIESESKNVAINAIRLNLKAQVPLFDAPKAGEPNDGKGIPGTDNPAGYLVNRTDFSNDIITFDSTLITFDSTLITFDRL